MKVSIALLGLVVLTAGSGSVLAQERTPPKTSVKALEPPVDYRHKQFHRYHRPHRHYGQTY